MSTPIDIKGVLERAGADANAPEGSQAWALARVDAAIAELVEENRRIATHLEQVVHFIESVYPNSPQLDRRPILRNMNRWAGRIRAAIAAIEVKS